jgi:hypothetical protein
MRESILLLFWESHEARGRTQVDTDVPYIASIKNLIPILEAIQKAALPDAFNMDFLKDMGFASSNDRPVIKLFKFLGFLDSSNRPQTPYREFMDSTKAKTVLAVRVRAAYDDLFKADKTANTKTAQSLKGWFKTKTGVGDAVAVKMATTFRALAQYADFSAQAAEELPARMTPEPEQEPEQEPSKDATTKHHAKARTVETNFGLVYRIEIHLPDTQNLDTYRAIFRAIREELGE